MQLASEMCQPLFQFPSERTSHLEGHYYKYFWQSLANHWLSLKISGTETEDPPRKYDQYVMDVDCNDNNIPDRDIKLIFYYKSYL